MAGYIEPWGTLSHPTFFKNYFVLEVVFPSSGHVTIGGHFEQTKTKKRSKVRISLLFLLFLLVKVNFTPIYYYLVYQKYVYLDKIDLLS